MTSPLSFYFKFIPYESFVNSYLFFVPWDPPFWDKHVVTQKVSSFSVKTAFNTKSIGNYHLFLKQQNFSFAITVEVFSTEFSFFYFFQSTIVAENSFWKIINWRIYHPRLENLPTWLLCILEVTNWRIYRPRLENWPTWLPWNWKTINWLFYLLKLGNWAIWNG